MSEFLHIDLNVFMVAICVIMYFANRNTSDRTQVQNLLFRMLILSNMMLLVLEAATWLLDPRAPRVEPPAHIRALGVALPYALANTIFGGTAEYLALWFKTRFFAGEAD